MGSSFIQFNDKGFWSRDAALEVLYFLSDKIKAQPAAEPWLQPLGEHWHLQATFGFVGCIDAGLDTYVTDEHQIGSVIALCKSITDDLAQDEPQISRETLNALQTKQRADHNNRCNCPLHLAEHHQFYECPGKNYEESRVILWC